MLKTIQVVVNSDFLVPGSRPSVLKVDRVFGIVLFAISGQGSDLDSGWKRLVEVDFDMSREKLEIQFVVEEFVPPIFHRGFSRTSCSFVFVCCRDQKLCQQMMNTPNMGNMGMGIGLGLGLGCDADFHETGHRSFEFGILDFQESQAAVHIADFH